MVYIADLESRFTFTQTIGKGSYGEITRGVDNLTSLPIIRKRIRIPKSAIQEISIYSMIDHPNVCKLIAWSYTKYDWSLILPEGIPIENAIKNQMITLDTCIVELLNVVNFLHSNGIYHGDLKPSNVIYLNGKLTLIDFGSARLATEDKGRFLVKGLSPTVGYIDPEYSQRNWNPIKSELYSVAGVIWNLRRTSIGRPQEMIHRKVYRFVCTDSRMNGLFNQLTKFPISERKDLGEMIQNWSSVMDIGKVVPKHSPVTPKDPAYRRIVEELFSIFGQIPAWQMFLGIGLFRNVLEKLLPDYPDKIAEATDLGVTCMYLISLITHIELCIPSEWLKYIEFSLIGKIIQVTEGNLITESDWDRAESYEELVYYIPGLFGEILPTKRIPGYSKNVYFYKLLESSRPPIETDFFLQGQSYESFLDELECKLIHLQKPVDIESHIQHIACYFFLHNRKLLSKLSIERAQEVYNTLIAHPIGAQLLDIIVDYPRTKFENRRVHPFQVNICLESLDLSSVD